MRYFFWFLFISIGSSFSLNAQNIRYGLKAGANISQFKVDNYSRMADNGDYPIDFSPKPGFYLGVFVSFPISEKFQFQPEVLYSNRNMDMESIYDITYITNNGNTVTTSINQQLITIPLVLQYEFLEKLAVLAGPQPGFVISSDHFIPNTNSSNTNTSYDTFEMAGVFGLAYTLSEKLILEGRFGYGFIERNEGFSNVYQIGVNYKL